MQRDIFLKNSLALKGGTAINLTIFDLPRLSVDIDLDFAEALGRAEMLEKRGDIAERIRKNMRAHGYTLSEKSKKYHALDSFVYEYQNAGGMRDNLKIEINGFISSGPQLHHDRPVYGNLLSQQRCPLYRRQRQCGYAEWRK